MKLHTVADRVRFCIELDLASEPIGGHLLAGEHTRSFYGWLDLATTILHRSRGFHAHPPRHQRCDSLHRAPGVRASERRQDAGRS